MGANINLQIGYSLIQGTNFKIEKDICNNPCIEVTSSHRHSFHASYWILEGSGTHNINFKDYEIVPERIFYIKPEQVHFLQPSSPFRYSAIQFSEEFMLPYYSDHLVHWGNISTYKDIDNECHKRIDTLFNLILDELTNNRPNANAITIGN